MNFDIKDVKSWATRHEVKVDDKGYFSNSISQLQNDKYLLLTTIDCIVDDTGYCFVPKGYGDGFDFFLPVDAVKKDKSKKKHRPFKDAYEFYKFLVNPSLARKDFSNKLLLNLPITWRKKDTSNFTTTELITSVEVAVIDGCHLTSINNKELKYWFANYEIEINGEWQPFGAVEDCTGE